jgi:hypothetical protein
MTRLLLLAFLYGLYCFVVCRTCCYTTYHRRKGVRIQYRTESSNVRLLRVCNPLQKTTCFFTLCMQYLSDVVLQCVVLNPTQQIITGGIVYSCTRGSVTFPGELGMRSSREHYGKQYHTRHAFDFTHNYCHVWWYSV